MAYNSNNFNALQQQIQDLSRQYQQLAGTSQQIQPVFQQPIIPQPQPVSIPVPPRQVQYVEGISGARLYQDGMQPNSSEIIMDKDDNIFYQVSKDANGTPSKRIIRCRFTIEEDLEEEPTFLTRKDFDDFKEEIRQMFAASSQKQVTLSSPKTTTVKKEQKEDTK